MYVLISVCPMDFKNGIFKNATKPYHTVWNDEKRILIFTQPTPYFTPWLKT